MRAPFENIASQIIAAITAVVAILAISPACSAQIEQSGGRHLVIFIYNYSGRAIAPGELELRSIRDGAEEAISVTSTEGIPRNDYTWTYFPDPLTEGQHYRVIFRADCGNSGSESIYRQSRSFVFRFQQNWRALNLDRDDVISHAHGGLVRVEVNKAANAPEKAANAPEKAANAPDAIFAKPGDLIEIDCLFQGSQPTIVPKGGSHPQVVDVSPLGARPIIVSGKTVGVAAFFEAKSRGEDWISIEIDNVPHNYYIFVRSR
jgi:hypothetical protein